MQCPRCRYVMVEDVDEGKAYCTSCGFSQKLEGEKDMFLGFLREPEESAFLASWIIYRREMHRMLGIWSIPAFLNFFLAFFYFMAIGGLNIRNLTSDSKLILFQITSLQTTMGIVVNVFFSVFIIRMALDFFENGETSLARALGVFGDRLSPIIGAVVVFALSISIWMVLIMSGGEGCFAILCYFPLLMVCYWWMFALVILVSEGTSVREAFSASKEFATRRSSMNFTLYLFILLGLLSLFDQMMNITLANATGSDIQASILASAAKSIVQWLLYPFLIILIVSFYVKGREAIKREIAVAMGDKKWDEGGDGYLDYRQKDEESMLEGGRDGPAGGEGADSESSKGKDSPDETEPKVLGGGSGDDEQQEDRWQEETLRDGKR